MAEVVHLLDIAAERATPVDIWEVLSEMTFLMIGQAALGEDAAILRSQQHRLRQGDAYMQTDIL